MTWTRTERAALDYVIAQLEAGEWFETTAIHDLPPPAWDAMVQHLEAIYNTLPSEQRSILARFALHLRLLRRVEAWERGEEWARVWFTDDVGGDVARDQDWRWLCQRGRRLGPECQPRMTPWHPLWLDAPPYDPAVTPRMRREAREARRAAIHAVAKATFGTLAKAMPEPKR